MVLVMVLDWNEVVCSCFLRGSHGFSYGSLG